MAERFPRLGYWLGVWRGFVCWSSCYCLVCTQYGKIRLGDLGVAEWIRPSCANSGRADQAIVYPVMVVWVSTLCALGSSWHLWHVNDKIEISIKPIHHDGYTQGNGQSRRTPSSKTGSDSSVRSSSRPWPLKSWSAFVIFALLSISSIVEAKNR